MKKKLMSIKRISKSSKFVLFINKALALTLSILLIFTLISNLNIVKSNTVVKHWTFEDSAVNLSYDITEYNDASFVIKEYYFNSLSRTITGYTYADIIDGERWARPAVDSNTQNYWDFVQSDYDAEKHLKAWAALVTFMGLCAAPTIINYILLGANAALTTADSYRQEHNGLAPDAIKTLYQMACASEAAWDPLNTPGVIIPSFKPSVGI